MKQFLSAQWFFISFTEEKVQLASCVPEVYNRPEGTKIKVGTYLMKRLTQEKVIYHRQSSVARYSSPVPHLTTRIKVCVYVGVCVGLTPGFRTYG